MLANWTKRTLNNKNLSSPDPQWCSRKKRAASWRTVSARVARRLLLIATQPSKTTLRERHYPPELSPSDVRASAKTKIRILWGSCSKIRCMALHRANNLSRVLISSSPRACENQVRVAIKFARRQPLRKTARDWPTRGFIRIRGRASMVSSRVTSQVTLLARFLSRKAKIKIALSSTHKSVVEIAALSWIQSTH